jgi:hypothetical protein
MHKVIELVIEALSEDAREHSKFDASSFEAFFPEEPIADVAEAWARYCAIHEGNETINDLIKALA